VTSPWAGPPKSVIVPGGLCGYSLGSAFVRGIRRSMPFSANTELILDNISGEAPEQMRSVLERVYPGAFEGYRSPF
jgi:hypothetical protein